MTKAIRIQQTGGPEVMRFEDVEIGAPGPGEALVRHTAIGVNYIDVYHRTGCIPSPLPAGLGMEGGGRRQGGWRRGDRRRGRATASRTRGAARARTPSAAHMPAARLVAVPESIERRDRARR